MNIYFAALVMFLLEYFVLLKLFKRSERLEKISLIVAPLMMIVGYYAAKYVLKREPTIAEFFIAIMALEVPLALRGYKITPDAKVWERMIVAGTFGAFSYSVSKLA
jgi:positive regulator of sigma E activity